MNDRLRTPALDARTEYPQNTHWRGIESFKENYAEMTLAAADHAPRRTHQSVTAERSCVSKSEHGVALSVRDTAHSSPEHCLPAPIERNTAMRKALVIAAAAMVAAATAADTSLAQ